METLHAGVITLLRSALTGQRLALPESFDLNEAYDILYNHHLIGLGIQGAMLCGVSRTHPAVVKMTLTFCSELNKSRNQMQKLREVCEIFEANNIDYLPVKGTVIKTLYAKPEYRAMGDADILIRPEQYAQIKALLPTIGMQEKDNSDYEYTWESPELTLELHRHLVSQRFKNHYAHFSDSWSLAEKEENRSKYLLRTEEHFIYLIVHFVNHYLDGSICAKDICDFYVWRRAYPDMDEDYIVRQLKRLKLAAFYRNVLDLLDNWFGDAPATEAVEMITLSAFRGGIYDEYNKSTVIITMRQHTDKDSNLLKMKIKWFFNAVFPTPTVLGYTYPIVAKCPVLLPIFWVVHWFHVLFRDKEKIKRGMIVMQMADDNLNEYDTHLTKVGLETDQH